LPEKKPRLHARASARASTRRLFVIALLCALAPSSVAVYVASAQRRAAVRGTSEARGSAAPKKEREREEREREARARARRQEDMMRVGGARSKPQREPRVGQPWTGAAGVRRTNAAVMAAQSKAGVARRRPRLRPEREGPERRWLPHNPASLLLTSTPNAVRTTAAPKRTARGALSPSAADDATPAAPQTVGLNFKGASLADTGAFPPDSMGAVGPAQYVVAVNARIRSFNKTTGAADGVLDADPDVFFQSVMTPAAGNFTSDPRIRYDRLTGRWMVVIIDVPGGLGAQPNRIMLAVSDAAGNGVISASTVWTYYQFRQDFVSPAGNAGEFADYPTLGVDANALYIGCNMFGGEDNLVFTGTAAFVVRKSSILSGGPVVVTAFRNLLDPDTDEGPYAPQGVDNYDPAATEGYFVGVDGASFGTLSLRRVGDPGGTPVLSANILVTVADTSYPVPVPHLGNASGASGRLDALDDRLFAAHVRGGRLWTAHNIAVDTTGAAVDDMPGSRNAVRWYELGGVRGTDNGGVPFVVQSGTLFDTAASSPRHFWIPSVMVSGQGHAALGFSTAGAAARIDASTTGRLSSDAPGALRTPTAQYTSTTFSYNPSTDTGGEFGRRWGDYSYTALDPDDDMTMWTVQQYCDATNSYGVRVAKLLAPPPATPSSAGVSAVVAGQSSVNLTITGTSANGSGFFDPGAGFARRITATVTNGVTVNSVAYTDPTHVQLNVSTVGATNGPAGVTVINPDGQSATGSALFNVTGGAEPSGSPVLITEFRFRGPAGGSDEFVELYNNTDSPLAVADTAGGAGYAVAGTNTAGAGSLRCTVPNGTVIPARGHFLCANNAASGYGLGAIAAADAAYATGVVDGGGVAVFSTTNAANWNAATRLDSVGFQGITGTALFTEGTALAPAGGVTAGGEYSFVRRMATANSGLPQDTNNNQSDFVFVSTTGAAFGGAQSALGAPGPENLASPVNRNASISVTLLDPGVGASSPPNRTRDLLSDPANNSSFGTMTIRRTLTNTTGGAVTRLRFRVIDLTTFPSTDTTLADLRLRTSRAAAVAVTGSNAACPSNNCAVQALTLDAPSAAHDGGLNATVSAGTVTLAAPLANGAALNVQFLLGVEKTGNFRFYVNVEALP
jgi:hypothetical protein